MELTLLLEKIQRHYRHQLPFVVYCKPEHDLITVLLQRDSTKFSAVYFDESGFLFAAFDGASNILLPHSACEMLFSTAGFPAANTKDSLPPETDKEGQAFEKLVEKAILKINEGAFTKVVLSRKEHEALTDFDLPQLIVNLFATYPSAFRYCFFHPDAGLWMGATPEQLLKVKNNKFSTVALAGTQKFNESATVEWQSKERTEQQHVTDYILENLKDSASEVSVSAPSTHRAGNLLHIKTNIDGIFKKGSDTGTLIKSLHPTPAVCGMPKRAAAAFIMENEGYDREFYTGYLGELNVEEKLDITTDLYVNLRCMKLTEQSAALFVGCGVTGESNPHNEFMETVFKSETMKKIL